MDKLTKKVLKHFIKQNKPYTISTMCSDLNISNRSCMQESFNTLLELKCVKIEYSDLDTISYSLTYIGKNYFKTSRSVKFEKYWFPILTAIVSYLLSLASSLLMK